MNTCNQNNNKNNNYRSRSKGECLILSMQSAQKIFQILNYIYKGCGRFWLISQLINDFVSLINKYYYTKSGPKIGWISCPELYGYSSGSSRRVLQIQSIPLPYIYWFTRILPYNYNIKWCVYIIYCKSFIHIISGYIYTNTNQYAALNTPVRD